MNRHADSEFVDSVVNTIETALSAAGVDPGRPLLVAVSGGADSMTALDALHAAQERGGPRVIVCHFNHRMRGADSDADEEYVRAAAERRGLEYVGDGADVGAHAREHRLSTEDAARRLRYGFLARAAVQTGAQGAATGHTLDDQAETVLLHIARGSGLGGVRGMRLVSQAPMRWGGVALTVFRPLLRLRREDTEMYCRERGIVPRLDVSNESTTFARNRLRRNVMPELEAINPRVAESITRLAETAAEEVAALQEVIEDLWARVMEGADPASGAVTLNRDALLETPPALRRFLMRRAYVEAAGNAIDLARRHVEEMVRLCAAGAGRTMDLPGGLALETRAASVIIGPAGTQDNPHPPLLDAVDLAVPGRCELPGGASINFSIVERPESLDTGSDSSTYADADAVGPALTVRNRREGDRFQPLGMQEAVRIQDLFVNAGVPRGWRDRVPLLENERGIAWVPGLRVAEWARVRPDTGRVLRIDYEAPGKGGAPV